MSCATAPTVAPLIFVLLLVAVTAVWGWTFVLVKDAITQYPTLAFLQLRFILATLVMVILVHRLPSRRELWTGAVAGGILAGGYLAQTVGLTMTSPGNAGLITGLFVVFTPLLNRVFGATIRWWTWIAVLVSLGGLVLLTGGPSGMSVGDLLVLACAGLFALHIVLLGRWSPGMSPAMLTLVQIGMCTALFSFGGTWSLRPPSGSVWFAIVITGLFASAFGYFIQTWAQGHVGANRVALILATEPAWALVAAITLAGQRFGLTEAAGAALIVAAIVGHEGAALKFERHVEPAPPS